MVGRAKILIRFIDRLAAKEKLTAVIEIDTDPTDSDFQPKKIGSVVHVQTTHLMQSIEQICQQFQPGF